MALGIAYQRLEHKLTSIRRFLTLTIISALVLIIFSAALKSYRATLSVTANVLDKELASLSQALNSVHSTHTESTQNTQDIIFQVWRNHHLIDASANTPSSPLTNFSAGYSEQNFAKKRWRVLTYFNATDNLWIMVGQPIENRYTLTDTLTTAAIWPFILTVPLIALAVFLGITWGLHPLKKLSSQLAQRRGKDLSPVELSRPSEELQPVVNTLNSIFKRLNDAFEREQQFAANAAHELRTPLSVMKITIHNIANELGDNGAILLPLQHDTDRMIHAVNQLLVLSRTSPEVFIEQRIAVDIYHVAQEVITDIYQQVEKKQQDIALEGTSAWLKSTPFSIYTLLQNLIANAINYSPENARILVKIQQNNHHVILSVEDSGPGIPPSQRDKVLERFQRAPHSAHITGSGLGLAIVAQIIQLHDANISLGKSSLGGLSVTITFNSDAF